MFLNTAGLKKMMKAALKSAGLYVGTLNEKYVVHASEWGLQTEIIYASNKFRAAVVELIGDFPEDGEYYRYWLQDGEVQQEPIWERPEIYESWKLAKDYAVPTPLTVASFPYEFQVFQTHGDMKYIWVRRERAGDLFSYKELDSAVERMPERPSYGSGTLYWKNDTTIYYVHRDIASEKTEESLFLALNVLDFSKDDWIAEAVSKTIPDPDTEEDPERTIPY